MLVNIIELSNDIVSPSWKLIPRWRLLSRFSLIFIHFLKPITF